MLDTPSFVIPNSFLVRNLLFPTAEKQIPQG